MRFKFNAWRRNAQELLAECTGNNRSSTSCTGIGHSGNNTTDRSSLSSIRISELGLLGWYFASCTIEARAPSLGGLEKSRAFTCVCHRWTAAFTRSTQWWPSLAPSLTCLFVVLTTSPMGINASCVLRACEYRGEEEEAGPVSSPTTSPLSMSLLNSP